MRQNSNKPRDLRAGLIPAKPNSYSKAYIKASYDALAFFILKAYQAKKDTNT